MKFMVLYSVLLYTVLDIFPVNKKSCSLLSKGVCVNGYFKLLPHK